MCFTMNDDRMVMEFLSGRYLGTPDGHSIYMNYPLTFLIKSMYEIFPSYDWYSYLMVGIQMMCIILILIRVATWKKEGMAKWYAWLGAAALILFTGGSNLIMLTYSTVAAMTGVTTLFWYGTSKGSRTDVIISGILAALTWCIREELLIMILPAAGLLWLFREFMEEKVLYRRFMTPLCVVLCVGICILCDSAAYASPEWQEYNAYNRQIRTEIYDYGSDYYFPNYDENQAYFEETGITKEQRRLLIYGSFLYVQDEVPTETMEHMVAVRGNYGDLQETSLKIQIKNGTQNLAAHLREGRYGIRFQAAVIGFLTALIILAAGKERKAVLQTGVIFAALLGMVWLMEVRGRVPERVADSLAMMSFSMMILCWIRNRKELFKPRLIKSVVIAAVLLMGLSGVSVGYRSIAEAQQLREHYRGYDQIRDYCQKNPENFYVINLGALSSYGMNVNFGKVDNAQNNYISAGDWMAYSPIQKERLAQASMESAAEAVLKSDSVYIISGYDSLAEEDNYMNYLVDYLESRFKKEIVAEQIDEIKEYCYVYQLTAVEKSDYDQ